MALDATANSFEAIAREWFEKHSAMGSASVKLLARLEANVFPWLGDRPIRNIKAPELLSVMRLVESRGVLETAHRLMNYCGHMYRYAVATGRAERDISSDLRGALPPTTPQHHASVTDPEGVADLLCAIDGYCGSNVTRCALQLAPKREHRQRRFEATRLERLGNDRARVSQHGVHPAQRTGMESGCHPAPARASERNSIRAAYK
jgi:integrase